MGLFERFRSTDVVDEDLLAEVSAPPPWMYPWQLTGELATPIHDAELPDIHRTRLELIEAPVREALDRAGPGSRVIDLACNEGWFSHRMLDWGASHVLGIDIRPRVVRRAELIRDHFGIAPSRLEFRCGDVYDLDAAALGTFDVVLCLGLIYHLENPIGALRIARALTGGVCAIEAQLTRLNEPVQLGNGRSEIYEQTDASWAARVESDWETNFVASSGGIVSLTPNRAALLQAAAAAGFTQLEVARPNDGHNRQYVLGDRAALIARPGL